MDGGYVTDPFLQRRPLIKWCLDRYLDDGMEPCILGRGNRQEKRPWVYSSMVDWKNFGKNSVTTGKGTWVKVAGDKGQVAHVDPGIGVPDKWSGWWMWWAAIGDSDQDKKWLGLHLKHYSSYWIKTGWEEQESRQIPTQSIGGHYPDTKIRQKDIMGPGTCIPKSLEGLLKLKLQYFGHLMRRTDPLDKTLMLGKIEGRRRREWQRLRWLDGIIDSMDMFDQTPGDSEGQGSLMCCSPWGHKELDTTEQLNNIIPWENRYKNPQ